MAKPVYPSSKLDQYIVRFPDGMRDRLKSAAASNNRSLNAEIIARLEASFAMDEADSTIAVFNRGEDGLGQRLGELSQIVREITDAARLARRMTEPVERTSAYGFIRDDTDHTIKPPPEWAVSLTREELAYLRDDEREEEGKPRLRGPRPTGDAGKRLDFLRERLIERRKQMEIQRLLQTSA